METTNPLSFSRAIGVTFAAPWGDAAPVSCGEDVFGTVPWRFTALDRIALDGWRGETAVHGYRRVDVASELVANEAEATFALIYPPGTMWAAWGVARCRNHVLVWRCGTGVNLGRFATMASALAAIPRAGG